jgi:hypothetical protein
MPLKSNSISSPAKAGFAALRDTMPRSNSAILAL